MGMHDGHDHHMDLKVGDQIYCGMRKLRGFVTRTDALGLHTTKAIGIQWENGKRDVIFGEKACCMLTKVHPRV